MARNICFVMSRLSTLMFWGKILSYPPLTSSARLANSQLEQLCHTSREEGIGFNADLNLDFFLTKGCRLCLRHNLFSNRSGQCMMTNILLAKETSFKNPHKKKAKNCVRAASYFKQAQRF